MVNNTNTRDNRKERTIQNTRITQNIQKNVMALAQKRQVSLPPTPFSTNFLD